MERKCAHPACCEHCGGRAPIILRRVGGVRDDLPNGASTRPRWPEFLEVQVASVVRRPQSSCLPPSPSPSTRPRHPPPLLVLPLLRLLHGHLVCITGSSRGGNLSTFLTLAQLRMSVKSAKVSWPSHAHMHHPNNGSRHALEQLCLRWRQG